MDLCQANLVAGLKARQEMEGDLQGAHDGSAGELRKPAATFDQESTAAHVGVNWTKPGLDTKHLGALLRRGVSDPTPSPVSTLDFGTMASPVCI